MIEVLLILLAIALVAACGTFVAAEFALITVDRGTVERAAEDGDTAAQGALTALTHLSTQLSAAQVGITVTNLLIGFMAEPSIAKLIDGPLESLGLGESAATGTAVVIALVLATTLTMVFGELVPKNLAIARPLATVRAVQGFQRGFARAASPLVRALNAAAGRVVRRFGVEPQEELASARSAGELSSLVRRSADQGTLERDTAVLVQRSLTFGDRRAADVMTPRVKVHLLDCDEPAVAVLRLAQETGRSRFPVFDDAGERLAGVVHIRHALAVPFADRERIPVREIMVEPVVVPASVELDPLLTQLRRGGLQLAIVADEWGNVDGIVTLEDLVEEIVGDVRDEHDEVDDSVRPAGERRWDLSGLLRPDEAGRAVGLTIPEDEEYETLAGLVALRLERLPDVGDAVAFDTVDRDQHAVAVTLTVLRMEDLRVDRIALAYEPVPEADLDAAIGAEEDAP